MRQANRPGNRLAIFSSPSILSRWTNIAIFREDSIYVKFMEEVIKPNTEDSLVLDFEMDPGKDVRFS